MSEQRAILGEMIDRLCRDAAARTGFDPSSDAWPADLWRQTVELGLPALLVPEADGGIGGTWEDAAVVQHAVGRHCLPLPLGEAMMAAALLAGSAVPAPDGITGLASQPATTMFTGGTRRRFTGTLRRVPWGRHLDHVVTIAADGDRAYVVLLSVDGASSIRCGRNLAGEPRDDLAFADAPALASPCDGPDASALFTHGALLRIASSAGALSGLLARSVQHAKERSQFGRPIGDFQAIQQQLAILAGEAAAVACASRAAAKAAAAGEAAFEIAAAKLRANQAIDVCTGIAHQVHGAIGFTREHALHHLTQRLWSWRSEFGNDRYWADRLGTLVAARGADAFWPDLTSRADRVGGLSPT